MQVPVIFLAFANDKVDNARYLRNLPQELDGIRKALLPAIQANLCEVIERANVTIENILDTFQDDRYRDRIAILHYGGHADGYQLLLEQLDGSHAVAQGGGLVSFFARQKGLKLVFFNGCSTHQQSIELMQAGIPAVVGTSNAISDDIATDLSIRFYKGMAQGMTLDRAWSSAIDEIKIKKGEGNTRGLYRKEAAKQMIDERFPWDLFIREGSEIVKEFNLPAEVNNPLFGLPEIPKTYNLPEVPYQFLTRYERCHAEVFVGRSGYIRDLYNRITDKNSTPIISIYGQAGVGKSSLFDAGLRPRLENSHTVVYISRIKDKGLLGTLEEALGIKREQEVIEAERESLLNASKAEVFEQKPVDFAFFVDSAFKVDTPTDPQTSEGEAISEANSKELLVKELRMLAEKADLVLQSTMLKFIEQLILADEVVKDTAPSLPNKGSLLLRTWKEIEEKSGKPLVIMLDHIEECYTRPMITLGEESEENARMNMGEMEIEIFLQEIKKVFDDPSNLPKGKLLLGYRKEYHPDFEEWFKWYKLPQNKVFVDNLTRDEIIDVIQGITATEKLRRNYQISIETGLAEIIADDLLEDHDSAITPILQMTLMKLWKSCEQEGARLFTIQKYQEFKKAGLLMEDFVNDQLSKMREWNQKAEESGLVLDILKQHTTDFGRAGMQDKEKLKKLYAHKSKTLGEILEKAKELYLLVDLGSSTGLAHDALAPIIQEKYRKSMYPAQRALRLLENKIVNFAPNDKSSSVLDERELGIVEDGGKGMRFWKDTELEFIKASQKRREINKQRRLARRIAYILSIISVISFTVYSWYLKGKASQAQTRAEASQLMTLAIQNDDMTMALRLAARADSLAMQVGDSSMREKLIEILATGSFYSKHWKEKLSDNSKICTDKEGNKILFLDENQDLVLKDMAGEELLRMNNQDISHFDLSPDGRKILTLGNSDHTVRIWDMGGKQLLFFQEQIADNMVIEAGFLPNGAGFYTNTNNTTIKLIDLKGSKFYEHNAKANEYINHITFSPYAETMLLAVGISDDNDKYSYELQSWNVKNGTQNYVLNHGANIYKPCFSPDGTLFALVSDDKYSYLYSNQGDTLAWWTSAESRASQIVFSADGKMIFTAHENNIIKQYKTDLVIQNFKLDGYDNPDYFSDDDDYIVPVRAFEERSLIDFMMLTPDGNWLLTVNKRYGIKFWDLKNHYKILYGEVNKNIYPIAFAADGKEFFTSVEGGTILSDWQIDKKGAFEKKEINVSDTIDGSLSFNSYAMLRMSDSIRLLDFDLRILLAMPYPNTEARFFSKLSSDGQHIINFWADTIEVWNIKKERIAFVRETATNVFLTPNHQYLVTINWADEGNFHAKLWDLKGKLLQTLKGHTAYINDVSFSADSRYIATASQDQTAKIWDMNGKEITTLSGHYQAVNTVVFSPKSNYILTGSDDYTARLWNLSGEELNMYVAHKVREAAFSPDETKILTSGTHDFNQKDFFNISKSNRGGNQSTNEQTVQDNYFISTVILWDVNQDCAKWLSSDKIANFTLTDYLYAGASISVKTLLSLEDTEENAEQLNDAGFYYMSTDIPISGVPQGKRLRYAKDLFEKSLKIQRSKGGVAGLVEVNWRRKGKYDVGDMLKTKDIDELEWYMKYIYAEKLSAAKNKSDSSIYWRGLKKIAEKSLKITQTPQAISTLKKANYVLGDTEDDTNTKMAFNGSLSEMRTYADFFKDEGTFKKVSLVQAAQVYEHIFKSLKPTSQDFKGAAQVYSELAWQQLLDKEVIEAEKSVNRGIELDKTHRPLYINQILIYLLSNRYDSAKKLYLREAKNGKIAIDKSLKQSLKEDIEKLEKAGLKIDETKASWLK